MRYARYIRCAENAILSTENNAHWSGCTDWSVASGSRRPITLMHRLPLPAAAAAAPLKAMKIKGSPADVAESMISRRESYVSPA